MSNEAPQDSSSSQAEGSMDILLECKNLSAWYGAAQALFEVNLEVRQGEVVALMGRNGAGKSTLLKSLMRLMPQTSGQVNFLNRDESLSQPFELARKGLGYVPEDRRIFGELTVLENLSVGRQAKRFFPNGEEAPFWDFESLGALFPNLAQMPHRLGSEMSGGEQQMLTLARTLMGNPLVILLDEPTEGVAPLLVELMAQAIRELKKRGVSILMSEQNLSFANAVADRVYWMDQGQITPPDC
jgi:branched-chain amino acid transport system ATP-binding protein